MDARFTTSESNMTAPKYSVGNFEFQVLKKKNSLSFSAIFLKNYKKRHISENTRVWAVNFEGKARNSWEYPDSTQLQGKEFQI